MDPQKWAILVLIFLYCVASIVVDRWLRRRLGIDREG